MRYFCHALLLSAGIISPFLVEYPAEHLIIMHYMAPAVMGLESAESSSQLTVCR